MKFAISYKSEFIPDSGAYNAAKKALAHLNESERVMPESWQRRQDSQSGELTKLFDVTRVKGDFLKDLATRLEIEVPTDGSSNNRSAIITVRNATEVTLELYAHTDIKLVAAKLEQAQKELVEQGFLGGFFARSGFSFSINDQSKVNAVLSKLLDIKEDDEQGIIKEVWSPNEGRAFSPGDENKGAGYSIHIETKYFDTLDEIQLAIELLKSKIRPFAQSFDLKI